MNNSNTQKEVMRAEAKRARALLTLDSSGYDRVSANFFDNIELDENIVVAAYWSVNRELDTHNIIDDLLGKNIKVALPVIQKDSRILKFVEFHNSSEMVKGDFGICHPEINNETKYLSPDVFIVPLLAFDRKGHRLGYGGGYYDSTLAHYKEEKDIVVVGFAYAEQACLFNLPTEDHDVKMDWVITQYGANSY